MRQKVLITALVALCFCLFITAPVLAQNMSHSATYDLDGVMNFKIQAGHACNTGAEFKQVITGSGKMDKTQTVTMVKGKITMDDKNNWVAGATPLTVTSVWKLCTPPKYTYDGVDQFGNKLTAPVDLKSIYGSTDIPAYWDGNTLVGTTPAQLAKAYGWDALTEQIWATQVQSNPGFSGNLQQNGEAAYGPYQASGTVRDENRRGTTIGKEYVGDFFKISEQSRVAQGVLRRYIDISSPKDHGYVHEDMSVVGKASIRSSLSLSNYSAGKDVVPKWYNLF